MSLAPAVQRLMRPSLGKVGLSGITLSLALLAFAPAAPVHLVEEQATPATQIPVAAQIKANTSPRG